MKRISALALLFVASLAVNTSAFAQNPGVKAHIPFAFAVADTWMPAGDYIISTPGGHIIYVRKADNTASITLMSLHSEHESKSGSELEFNKYGDSYFLSRVLCPIDSAMNVDLAHGKAEKKARTLEASLGGGKQIMIAAK
jgi:hypothetical protein